MTMTAQNNAPPAVDNGQGSNVPAVALGTPSNVNIGAPASAPAATSGGIVNAADATVGPETSMAQHVLDALGGTGDKPGDWAKAVIAGGLTSTATKGSPLSDMPDTSKMPKGASPVAFAIGETMKNRDARLRQSRMDAQAQKQQQFENQMKSNQDARAQKELDNSTKSTDAQVAMYTIQTAAAKRQEWEMEQRYPDLRREDQDRVRQLDAQVRTSESESMAVLAAAGVDVTKLQHITDSNDLTKDQVTQAAQGQLLALPNGKKGGTGDGGAYLASASIWDQKITEPVTVTKGWTVDNKTGKETPIQITAQPGTTVGTLLAIAKGAQADRQTKHQAITDQLDIEQKQAAIRRDNAETIKANQADWVVDPASGQMYNKRTGQYKLDEGESAPKVPWAPKVGEGEKQKTTLAEMVGENGESIRDILQRRPDLVGKVAGHYTSFSQMIGDDDGDIQRLGTAMQNLAKASVGIHGMRSYVGVEAAEKTLLNGFRNGPNAINAAIDEQEKSSQVQIDNTRNKAYGTHSEQGGVGNYYHRVNNAAPKSSPAYKIHQSMADFAQGTPSKEHGMLYTDDGKTWYQQDGSVYAPPK